MPDHPRGQRMGTMGKERLATRSHGTQLGHYNPNRHTQKRNERTHKTVYEPSRQRQRRTSRIARGSAESVKRLSYQARKTLHRQAHVERVVCCPAAARASMAEETDSLLAHVQLLPACSHQWRRHPNHVHVSIRKWRPLQQDSCDGPRPFMSHLCLFVNVLVASGLCCSSGCLSLLWCCLSPGRFLVPWPPRLPTACGSRWFVVLALFARMVRGMPWG